MEYLTKDAIRLAGGPAKVAAAIRETGRKCTPQAVSQWKQVPDVHVLLIERLTSGGMNRYSLRPDVFGTAPAAEKVAA